MHIHVYTIVTIPYSPKFSRDPIFAEGQSAKILRSNFRGWTFQNCSTHNTAWHLAPPLTARAAHRCSNRPINLQKRLGEMARESHMIEAIWSVVITCTRKFGVLLLEKSYLAWEKWRTIAIRSRWPHPLLIARARAGRENVRLGFYFADLIFVVCQSTATIRSLENFRLYGNS